MKLGDTEIFENASGMEPIDNYRFDASLAKTSGVKFIPLADIDNAASRDRDVVRSWNS